MTKRPSTYNEDFTIEEACMAHKLETVHISFGLVTIPIGIYSAIEEQDIHFHELHAACGSRIKQQHSVRYATAV